MAGQATHRSADGQPRAKRTKLKAYDQMAAQLFNSEGESVITTMPLPQFAEAMAGGNQNVAFFNELCDPIPSRKGIAISRLSELQLLNGFKLQEEVFKQIIDKDVYAAAMQEFTNLESAFKVVSGRDIYIQDEVEAAGGIAYARRYNGAWFTSPRPRTPAYVIAAVSKVYAWLQQPVSKLRQLTRTLSSGGLFYATAVQEKCHRAYIKHGFTNIQGEATVVPEEIYAMWACARLCATPPTDVDGLI